MPPLTHDPAQVSSCTTCDYADDFSNYWTANLYFRARNGTYKRVPQMVNLGLQGREGVTVYYIPPYDGKTRVTAFPKVRLCALQCTLFSTEVGAGIDAC